MMYLRIVLLFALALVTTDSLAQSRKERKRKAETADQQPTSMDPSYPKKDYAPKASRKSSGKPTRELEEEYYERMENVQKEKRKSERLLSKPQYSDPLYFGHKRPPKKRKASKMKFCKECGIRH
jgi:hypothetical protein